MNLRKRRLPAHGISSPVIAEDAYWQQHSQWGAPTVDTAEFAKLLGVSIAAFHKLTTRDPNFPQPAIPGRPKLWTKVQAFECKRVRRQNRGAQIPRIYHQGDGLQPAMWVGAERHAPYDAYGSPKPWIVHIWQPADDRGPVAVAYGDVMTTGRAAHWAPRLLQVLESVTAVAVVSDEMRPLPGEVSPPGWQAELAVAERQHGAPPGTAIVETCGWFDLANLLRVNLPWWPAGLRRLDDIQAWRPGAAPQSVRPSDPLYDPNTLNQLLAEAADDAEADRCRSVVDVINARLEAGIYAAPAHPDVPGGVERPGLFQAAYPRNPNPTLLEPPTLGEVYPLMNLRVPSEAARQKAVELLSHRNEVRELVGITVCTSEDDGPLAREWISRLKPCEDPQTLGAMFARRTFTDDQRTQPCQWWYDPRADFGWIAKTTDGTYHATVGTRMPADGRLTAFEVEARWCAAFYRAAGTVWPMPLGGSGYYTCGYRGTGPDNLIAAVCQLHVAADAYLPDSSDTRGAPAALKQLVHTREAPLTVDESELAEVMDSLEAEDTQRGTPR